MNPAKGTVACGDCGTDLSGVGPGGPCPECGSHTRAVSAPAGLAEASAVATPVGARLAYAEVRPWQEKWRTVLKAQDDVKRAYSGWSDGPSDSEDWKKIPIDFCNHCYHLMDWIKCDPAVPTTVQDAVDGFVSKHTAIMLARDVFDTDKHHTRWPGKRPARIAKMERKPGSPPRAEFTVGWRRPDGIEELVDARDLARDAVAEWRDFLTQNQLNETE